MTSKRAIKRRSCKNKKPYSDQTRAVAALISLNKEYGNQGHHTYSCDVCGQWHIGRPNRNIRKKMGWRA